MGLPLLYFAFVALPIFWQSAWSDWETKKIDTRPLYAIIGLAYGGFFANGLSIFYAVAVSFSLILLQYFNGKAKLPPWGAGDFPLLQAFTLPLMLYSTSLLIFVIFMLTLLIAVGLWRWYFNDKSFAPSVLLTFLLFGFAKLIYI